MVRIGRQLARERESVERALNGLSDEQAEVICVHEYFEGLLHRSLFEQLLAGCRARGLKTTTLREAARSIATDAAPLPACRVGRDELGGFAASVSWQEPSVNTRYDERASAVRHRA
ncbi:MAG: hypothetical protein JSV80_02125 [Acidobacteriota bacterium]|nr:MAG: hypothetical protein JSV80_02125 [Acidobacteriota bacterium]